MAKHKKHICVLGSSYIGAVYTAYSEMRASSLKYQVDFYGHGNGGFPNVLVTNGWITNTRFSSAKERKQVSAYDALVIYADLPSPHDLEIQRIKLAKSRYSAQVIRDTLEDVVFATKAYRLKTSIAAEFGIPVFMVSANIMSHISVKMNQKVYKRNVDMITSFVGARCYIPFPDELFGEDLLPNKDYYKGSIKLTGEKADEQLNKGHDFHHMNEKGGGLVLKQLFNVLAERL